MRKLKYVKLFEGFEVNEGFFDIFLSKEKKAIRDLKNDLKNTAKFRIVEVGSPEYKSYDDIKEGDFFIGKECVELLEMGKKDLAAREWTISKVEAVLSKTIKIERIFLNGTDCTDFSGRFEDVFKWNCHHHFTHKIIMK